MQQFKIWNIRIALVGKAPAYKIAADMQIFPAGTFPNVGWLLHLEQICVIRRKEPLTTFLMITLRLKQNRQIVKRSNWAESYTMSLIQHRRELQNNACQKVKVIVMVLLILSYDEVSSGKVNADVSCSGISSPRCDISDSDVGTSDGKGLEVEGRIIAGGLSRAIV